jgi:hypothetical protein
MTKSYVRECLEVYFSILADVQYAYPSMSLELSKDSSRLNRLVSERGLPFLMVDLPQLGKHLDRCVSEGQYKVTGLPGSRRVSRTVVIPKLFRGLYLLIFHKNGRLKEHIDEQAYSLLRQLLYGAKKARYQCSQDATEREVAEFIETDGQLPHPSPWWDSDTVGEDSSTTEFKGFALDPWYSSKTTETSSTTGSNPACVDQTLLTVLDTVVGIVSTTLGPYRFDEWRFKHGPGAVSDLPSGANRYRFSNWSKRLESEFPVADCAFHNFNSWAAGTPRLAEMTAEEPMSKLIAVPKTLKKPRLIASEPSDHMWCQQNVKHFMYARVQQTWIGSFIRFQDQTLNQTLCLRGSLDGSLVTVDLSAASDRVSCNCVGNTFRQNRSLLHALRSSRTRRVQLSLWNRELCMPLRKYSTMGNATTFPVESLIFLSIAIASALVAEDPHLRVTLPRIKSLIGRVSVFGDDIIAPKESVVYLLRLLEVLDFKVNYSKSYLTGRFRESCGVDAYAGVQITPAYWQGPVEETPKSVASALEVSNNFYKKFLVKTSEHIRSTIPAKFSNWPVTSMDSGIFGLRSFVSPRVPLDYKSRWNADLQRTEFLALSLSSKQEKTPIEDETALLQFFTEQPEPSTKWRSGVAERPVLKIKHQWYTTADLSPKEEMEKRWWSADNEFARRGDVDW